MRSDDLVPLLAPPVAKGISYRQGVVVSWNQDTAENTVMVGASLLTNLPVLNSTEANLLVPGDVVGILVSGATWAILGRLIIPGTSEAATAIQSITNRIQAASDFTSGTRNSTAWGDLAGTNVGPAVTIRIGSSGRALVLWSAEQGQTLNYHSLLAPHVGVQVTNSGGTVYAPDLNNALNFNISHPVSPVTDDRALTSIWVQAGTTHLYEGIPAGDTTFTLKYCHQGNTPSEDITYGAREIAVFAL